MSQTADDLQLTIDAGAAVALRRDLGDRMLRIAFTTGCGGSGYRLSPADEPSDGDKVMRIDDVTIALDPMAAKSLNGAVIRASDEDDGYTLDHPDAVTAVWCG